MTSLEGVKVALALGAEEQLPTFPPGSPPVYSMQDLLLGRAVVSGLVVLLDETGSYAGTTVAEFLGVAGVEVHAVTPHFSLGRDLPTVALTGATARLLSLGVRVHSTSALHSMHGRTAIVLNLLTMSETRLGPVDAVAVCGRMRPRDALYQALEGRMRRIIRVGDCVSPRTAFEAVHEGDQAISRLELRE